MAKKQDYDFSIHVLKVVEHATRDKDQDEPTKIDGKNPNAVALGRLGGLKGGKARAETLSPEKRKEIAKKAAQKRWEKK
jgi:hypothetical protein